MMTRALVMTRAPRGAHHARSHGAHTVQAAPAPHAPRPEDDDESPQPRTGGPRRAGAALQAQAQISASSHLSPCELSADDQPGHRGHGVAVQQRA